MDHLVQEIKENLKLGAAPPPPTPAIQLQTQTPQMADQMAEPSYQPPYQPPSGQSPCGKIKGGRSWTSVSRSRSSPYHVPASSRAVLANAAAQASQQCDSSDPSGQADQMAAATAALRRKWANGRRRYPSTCMNNNAATAAAKNNIDPDDPFAILQELISGGSLIKEAVRRLQKPVGVAGHLSGLTGSPSGNGGIGAGRMTPRTTAVESGGRRTAYDSEESDNEDCRTPPEDATTVQQPPSVRNRSFPCCEVGM